MLRTGTTAPIGLSTDAFVIEPLTRADVELDYECYLASSDVIRIHSDGRWQVEGFTLAGDLAQIERHEIDHQAGTSFAFVLLTPAKDQALGCVYLNPTPAGLPPASARVTFWIRQDRQLTDLPRKVAAELNRWLLEDWPLDAHVFRVLPTEESSVTALEEIGCHRIEIDDPGESRPYLWFVPPTSDL